MPDPDNDTETGRAAAEDLITSVPGRLDIMIGRVDSVLPSRSARAALLGAIALIAVLGLISGPLTPPGSAPESGRIAISTPAPQPLRDGPTNPLGRGLLTLGDLAGIGEPAHGGTYTIGSASALPDPCSRPALGGPEVIYIAGPNGATSVTFSLVGATVTERVMLLPDEVAARQRLRVVISRARDCSAGPSVRTELGPIGPGLGEEFAQAVVTRDHPQGTAATITILVVRVGAALVEFSLSGSGAAAVAMARCLAIARAGLAR